MYNDKNKLNHNLINSNQKCIFCHKINIIHHRISSLELKDQPPIPQQQQLLRTNNLKIPFVNSRTRASKPRFPAAPLLPARVEKLRSLAPLLYNTHTLGRLITPPRARVESRCDNDFSAACSMYAKIINDNSYWIISFLYTHFSRVFLVTRVKVRREKLPRHTYTVATDIRPAICNFQALREQTVPRGAIASHADLFSRGQRKSVLYSSLPKESM